MDNLEHKLDNGPFIADLVAKGWSELSVLNETIKSIDNLDNADKVKAILQELADAYLVCIGQLEGIVLPESHVASVVAETEPATEVAAVEPVTNEPEVVVQPVAESVKDDFLADIITEDVEVVNNVVADTLEEPKSETSDSDSKEHETWDYFCEFEDSSGLKISDDDIETLLKNS